MDFTVIYNRINKKFILIFSLIAYFLFGILVYFVALSKNVLGVTNMISYQKTLFLLSDFSLISYVVLKMINYSKDINLSNENGLYLIRLIRFLFFNSSIGYLLIILYYNLDDYLGYTVIKDRIEMNVLGVVLFSFIIPLAKFLASNYGKITQAVISLQLIMVFMIVLNRIFQGAIIVEFSAVAYLFVPIVFLMRIKKLYITAAYAGFMAGLFYYLYIILNGGTTYNTLVDYKVYLSMFSHGTLLLVSLIYMTRIRFSTKELLLVIAYLLFSLLWAIINRPETNEFRFFIYDIIDGELLHSISNNLTSIHYMIYYILLTLFLLFSMRVFLRINNHYNKDNVNTID